MERFREYLILSGILLVSIFFAFYPHMDYSHPLHRDEWDRITLANAVMDAESTTFTDPFLGEGTRHSHLEIGFILFTAGIKYLTGLSWDSIYRLFPVLVTALITLSVYILANRFGYGLYSAFFAAIIPTSVRILGPALFVPVSLGLVFLALGLFLLLNFKGRPAIIAYTIFLLFLLYEHPPTAMVLLTVSVVYILRERDMRPLPWTVLAVAFSLPQFIPRIVEQGAGAVEFSTFVYFSYLFNEFGILSTVFFVVGAFFLFQRNRLDVVLVYSTIVLLVLNLIYRYYDYTLFIMPERNYLYLMLLMAVIAGAGLYEMGVLVTRIPVKKTVKAGQLVVVLVVVASFVPSYQSLTSTPFYHVVNEEEYRDFQWIGKNYEGRAVLNPWKAMAFTAVAENPVYSTISMGPNPIAQKRNREIASFFRGQCSNTSFLRQNNVSIVYSPVECNSTDLEKVAPSTYILE